MKFAHIVNPVFVDTTSRFYFIQQVTFHTMQIAKKFASRDLDVEFISAQYPEDRSLLPGDFSPTPDLDVSVLNLGVFKKPRKLPLLRDILNKAYTASEADFLIFTNIDIGLLPNFYLTVESLIESGYDAFTINRRTISDHYTHFEQIPQMYADVGEPHRGWDCFIFQRDGFTKYKLGNVCIGIPRADLTLLGNLILHAKNFHEFRDLHVTFHLGNDRSWWNKGYQDYETHNTNEAFRVLTELEQENGPFMPNTPPATFLYFHRNRLRAFVYEALLRNIHIPARFGRPLRSIMRLLQPRR